MERLTFSAFSTLWLEHGDATAFGGGHDGLFIGTRRPAEDAARFVVRYVLILADLGSKHLHIRDERARKRTIQSGISLVETRWAAVEPMSFAWNGDAHPTVRHYDRANNEACFVGGEKCGDFGDLLWLRRPLDRCILSMLSQELPPVLPERI